VVHSEIRKLPSSILAEGPGADLGVGKACGNTHSVAAQWHRNGAVAAARLSRRRRGEPSARQSRCAGGAAPQVEAGARPPSVRHGDRQERPWVSAKAPLAMDSVQGADFSWIHPSLMPRSGVIEGMQSPREARVPARILLHRTMDVRARVLPEAFVLKRCRLMCPLDQVSLCATGFRIRPTT
jgi:hypothetical protein